MSLRFKFVAQNAMYAMLFWWRSSGVGRHPCWQQGEGHLTVQARELVFRQQQRVRGPVRPDRQGPQRRQRRPTQREDALPSQ